MTICVCIGSSCHLKGSYEIVELLQKAIAEYQLENKVSLAGSFCLGKCSRTGVTVQINDEVYVGVTREDFKDFFRENVLEKL